MNADPNPYASPAVESPPLVTAVVVEDAGWTIDYELRIDDYIVWNMHFHRTSHVARRQAMLAWVLTGFLILMIALLLPSLALDWPESIVTSAVIAIPGVALFCLFPVLRRWQLQRVIRRMYVEGHNYNLIGPRRLAISGEYVSVSSPWSHSLMRWAGIAEIRREPEAVYFCISSNTAYIVPRRAFAGAEQFQQFAQAAADFHAKAKPAVVA
ncbi:MAG TPA: YcxB family protein [Pirellulaceae bacterium]|nr:YcxB family protein [Pirellulaceae bacterium]